MQTAQAGTQEAEKAYITSTQPVRGYSYKLLNKNWSGYKAAVSQCWDFVEASINRNNPDLVSPEDVIRNLLTGRSHVWVSVDESSKIVGCLIMTTVKYPKSIGVMSEACGGKFIVEDSYPAFEEYYKSRGLSFIQISGRRGWDKVMKHAGYTLDHITLYKRL